jgi:hypothetical protein
MEFKAMTFRDYAFMDESYRLEVEECLSVAEDPYKIDCQIWTWGKVKEVQDTISKRLSYADILSIAQMESELLRETSPFEAVMKMHNSIVKSIKYISEIENKVLSGQLTPKELASLHDIGGFAEFGTIPQTMSLVSLTGHPYNEVLKMEWALCFAILAYEKKRKEFTKTLYKND